MWLVVVIDNRSGNNRITIASYNPGQKLHNSNKNKANEVNGSTENDISRCFSAFLHYDLSPFFRRLRNSSKTKKVPDSPTSYASSYVSSMDDTQSVSGRYYTPAAQKHYIPTAQTILHGKSTPYVATQLPFRLLIKKKRSAAQCPSNPASTHRFTQKYERKEKITQQNNAK